MFFSTTTHCVICIIWDSIVLVNLLVTSIVHCLNIEMCINVICIGYHLKNLSMVLQGPCPLAFFEGREKGESRLLVLPLVDFCKSWLVTVSLLFVTVTDAGFTDITVFPSSLCSTSWFRQRSTWLLKAVRSFVSWVLWHTGQMRTEPSSSDGLGCSKSMLTSRFRVMSLFLWPSSGSAWKNSCREGSVLFTSFSPEFCFSDVWHWISVFCELKSDSESVLWFILVLLPLRHWSMWLLKIFRFVVLTWLKHTGQVRPSECVRP